MMCQVLTNVAELTPARMTDIVARQSVLSAGEVVSVTVLDEAETLWSQVYHLRCTYSADTPAGAPARLFLKMGRGGEAEVAFYHWMARAAGAGLPVVPCYEAAWSPAAERSHLLMSDLADTHGLVAPWPLPPPRADGEAVVRQLAKFHARWWQHPGLGKEIGELQWWAFCRRSWSPARSSNRTCHEMSRCPVSRREQRIYHGVTEDTEPGGEDSPRRHRGHGARRSLGFQLSVQVSVSVSVRSVSPW
jgi:hypothetical protein